MGDNTRALLITRSLSEISRLAERMGGRKETLAGLAGMGDLIVTCTSMHSRTPRAALLLAPGTSTAPDGSMILGTPAKVVRELTEKEKESILSNATLYLEKSKEYRAHAAKQA